MARKPGPLIQRILDFIINSLNILFKARLTHDTPELEDGPFGDSPVSEWAEGSHERKPFNLDSLPTLDVVDKGYAMKDLWPAFDVGRATLDMNAHEFAHMLGVVPADLLAWRAAQREPTPPERKKIIALGLFAEWMREIFFTDESPTTIQKGRQWLRTNNIYFGGMTPREVIQMGHIDAVNHYLGRHRLQFPDSLPPT